MFSFEQWDFEVEQGLLMSSHRIQELALGFPEPTMPFESRVCIRHLGKEIIGFNTASLLKSCGSECEHKISVDSDFWKSVKMDIKKQYDWTYRPLLLSQIGYPSEEKSEIDMDLVSDQSKPIIYFGSCDFFEDELADNGSSVASFKIRVMEWGFIALVRHFLRIDHVLHKYEDLRLFHVFGQNFIVVDWTVKEADDKDSSNELRILQHYFKRINLKS